MRFYNKHLSISFLLLVLISLGGCARRKSDKKVSVMKNLTAHYNIYYNASELLKESEKNIQYAHKDNYDQLLTIFPLPTEASSEAEKENLNEVIGKANRIALEKFESNWVDDAFLLLAKSEYLKGNYYNAAEYFGYVGVNFPDKKEQENTIEALVWQGKSLFALQEYAAGDSVLQFAYAKNLKYHRAVLNAAIANSYIQQQKTEQAIAHLEKAIGFTKNRYEKIRWSFILAQLQEQVNNKEGAYKNYSKVVKSNASFEMSFNANLAQIRLREVANGIKFNKIATLTRLLKEDKNKEFKDQIYYQIANAYEQQGDLNVATEFYQTSAHVVSGSPKQKGLSYLRLAEINFDSLKNYVQAQLYYDSTLQSLPREYPGYTIIETKAKNLQYLADRLIIIERQQELLALANLPEEERQKYADEQIQKRVEQTQVIQNKLANAPFESITDFSQSNKSGGTFYFDNTAAISQGLNEFKRKWGNRKLEDNWRMSSGVSNLNAGQNMSTGNISNNAVNSDLKTTAENIDSLRNNILRMIPVSMNDQAIAKNKIKVARYEIAIFYKDVLEDNVAAIEELEELLKEYTLQDAKVAELYYQLYRLYEPVNATRSQQYKAELIKQFPESIFSKALLNPDFGKEEEAVIARLRQEYEVIYNNYQQKKYNEVIAKISSIQNNLESYSAEAPPFYYLKSLAIGHTQKAPAFIASLNEIANTFPNDTVVTPLVKSQLSFIDRNQESFNSRPTALLSYDPGERIGSNVIANNEQVIIPKLKPEEVKKEAPKQPLVKENPKPIAKPIEKIAVSPAPKPVENVIVESKSKEPAPAAVAAPVENTARAAEIENPKPIAPERPKAIAFSNNQRIKHVIIIDIKNSSLNVAKPFAALTKYFYSKFDPSLVNLTIRTISNTNKLIAARAQFNSKEQAEKVLAELNPQLKEILGLDANEFGAFVISEPNLLLITNTDALNQYLNYNK